MSDPQLSQHLNPFHATDLFWYLLKTSENLWFSDVSRGYQKRSLAWNGLRAKLVNPILYGEGQNCSLDCLPLITQNQDELGPHHFLNFSRHLGNTHTKFGVNNSTSPQILVRMWTHFFQKPNFVQILYIRNLLYLDQDMTLT